jgi:hypothetical protein
VRRSRPGLGAAAGAVALHQEHLGLGGVLLGAVLELAREEVHVHRGLAAGELARLARGLARERGLDDLAHDDAGVLGFSSNHSASFSPTSPSTAGRTSEETSLSLVWRRTWGPAP